MYKVYNIALYFPKIAHESILILLNFISAIQTQALLNNDSHTLSNFSRKHNVYFFFQ